MRCRARRDHGSLGLYVYDKSDPAILAAVPPDFSTPGRRSAPPDYGMVHHLTRPEHLEAMVPRRSDLRGDENGADVRWGFTVQLRRGLPTLYWRNLFGTPYVTLFGRERLLSAPAFSVEERPWGVALQLTPEAPSDASYPAFREVRERVIDHLGRDAFGLTEVSTSGFAADFDFDAAPTSVARLPVFDLPPNRPPNADPR